MRIYVSKEDIKHGERNSSISCPIARSLSRRGFRNVSVGTDSCGFRQDGTKYGSQDRYILSDKGSKFIKDFDDGTMVEPFHLYLKKDIK